MKKTKNRFIAFILPIVLMLTMNVGAIFVYADDGDAKATVRLEFGSMHAQLASDFATAINDPNDEKYNQYGALNATVEGSKLTIEFPKAGRKESDAMKYLDDALSKYLESGVDENERLLVEDTGSHSVGKSPLSEYADNNQLGEEWNNAGKTNLGDTLDLNVLWAKDAAVELTVTKPVCGTEVTGDQMTQEPRPQISVTGGKAKIFKIEDGDFTFTVNYWVTYDEEDKESLESFSGAIVGGETYHAMIMLVPEFGYYVDSDKIAVKSGTISRGPNGYPSSNVVFIDVEAEHDWGAWTVTKEATTTAEGVKTHKCKHCGKTETQKIPKKADPANQKGEDGTACGKGASAAAAEKAITSMKTDTDPAGSKFAPLKLKSVKQTKKAVTIKWTKVSGATKYVIYGNKCGKTTKPKKLATVTGKTKTIKKIAGKKLKKGTYYKFIVVALDKNNKVVSTSKLIHAATKGGKVGNHKSVTVKKAVVNKAKKLKKGKTLRLNAKAVAKSKKLKVKKHVAVRYESTNDKIATVTKKGVVKAKAKGTCYINAFAQNGVAKKIKVVVK